MPFAWTGSFRTWYAEHGAGFPIVFVHGHTFDSTMWDPQVEVLRQHYRLITYDLRGHGNSEVPAAGYWSAVYAEDLVALLDALEIECAVLVGSSVGGSAAVHAALSHPHRAAGVVLAGSSVGRPPETHDESEMHRRMWEITADRGFHAALEQVWLPGHLFDGVRLRPQLMESVRRMCLGYSGQGFRDSTRPTALPRVCDRLAELQVPVLAIYGSLDHPEVHTTADQALRDAPGFQRVVLPQAGHLVNLEEPAAFNRALLDFLTRCVQSRSA